MIKKQMFQFQACHALTMWIQNNSEYSSLLPTSFKPESFKFTTSFMSKELHDETTNLYIKAARLKQEFDPDVQVNINKSSICQ